MTISFYFLQESQDSQWNVVMGTGNLDSRLQTTVVESHGDKKTAKVAAKKLADTMNFPFIKNEGGVAILFSKDRYHPVKITPESITALGKSVNDFSIAEIKASGLANQQGLTYYSMQLNKRM